jgi:phenylacetate-coenzyme A ligase PaaK-like adenylate-forming protein
MTSSFEALRLSWTPGLQQRLTEHVPRLRWSADQIRAHQRDRLRPLLAHAIAHSPFHRRRLAGLDADSFEVEDLATLPIMTKVEMMDDLENVFTDRALTVAAVEQALAATGTEPVPILGRYLAITSGGSSGRRGVFVHDREASFEFSASITRALAARLLAMGGPPPGGLRIAMVCAASAVHATGTGTAWTAADDFPFRFMPVPVTLPLPEIRARLEVLATPLLYGYPSMLARLAAERLAGRLAYAPRLILSTAETLTSELREAITAGFGAPIVDNFGSSEGLTGTTLPDDPVLVFNDDVNIVELVGEDNRPVPDGTSSAKVLVTNLSNHLQPLIRYELNDRFIRHPAVAEHGHLRATVMGRSDDVLYFEQATIHPHVISAIMVKTPEVQDYQVRQTRRGVELLAVATTLDTASLRDRVASALAAAGLEGPEVAVRTVVWLERNAETGKLRRIVPLSRA